MKKELNVKRYDVAATTEVEGDIKLVIETYEGDVYVASLAKRNIRWLRLALKQAKELAYN